MMVNDPDMLCRDFGDVAGSILAVYGKQKFISQTKCTFLHIFNRNV